LDFGQKLAIIRLFFNIEPKTIDEFAKAWCQIEYLATAGFLGIAQHPFKIK